MAWPEASTIFLSEPGTMLWERNGYFTIRYPGGSREKIGNMRVERFMLACGCGVKDRALGRMMRLGIPLSILELNGSLVGTLTPPDSCARGAGDIRQAQYGLYLDKPRRVALARTLVESKVRNCRAVVRRYGYNHRRPLFRDVSRELGKLADSVQGSGSVDQAMGYEGAAARSYFSALAGMVPREFGFSGRSRRPPPDPVNALLSFGYVLLAREAAAFLEAGGFDPYVGFLHEVKPGRPSLALDLIEPLRPCVVDRLAVSLLNRRELAASDFRPDPRGGPGVFIAPEGKSKFLRRFREWMVSADEGFLPGGFLSARTILEREVRALGGAVLKGESGSWEPYRFR